MKLVLLTVLTTVQKIIMEAIFSPHFIMLSKLLFISVSYDHLKKPLSNLVRKAIKRSTFIRSRLCLPYGRWHHKNAVIYSKMKDSTTAKPSKVRDLGEERATNLGARLLSKKVVFGIGFSSAAFAILQFRNSIKAEELEVEELENAFKQLDKRYEELRQSLPTVEAEARALVLKIKTLEFIIDNADQQLDHNELEHLRQLFAEAIAYLEFKIKTVVIEYYKLKQESDELQAKLKRLKHRLTGRMF